MFAATLGATGAGVRLADVEYGWDLTHPDLAGVVTPLTFLPGEKKKYIDHGTQSIGVIGSQANGNSLTGIAPHAALAVAFDGWGNVFGAGHIGTRSLESKAVVVKYDRRGHKLCETLLPGLDVHSQD